MTVMIGRNVNRNDEATVTTYTLSTTATTISAANGQRIYFSVCLAEGSTDDNVAIRLYPAATDNTFKGEILVRRTAQNDALYRPSWTMMSDNIYTGEISAVCESGTVNVYVTEY